MTPRKKKAEPEQTVAMTEPEVTGSIKVEIEGSDENDGEHIATSVVELPFIEVLTDTYADGETRYRVALDGETLKREIPGHPEIPYGSLGDRIFPTKDAALAAAESALNNWRKTTILSSVSEPWKAGE